MRICEIYQSIQGEGKLTGMPSVIVRTSGCNLRCSWCDTPFASWNPEGDEMDIDAIVSAVESYTPRHVVITGGEPMIWPDIGPLTQLLRNRGYHITIETAGTIYRDVACDLASVSPKLSNSTPWDRADDDWADRHERLRLNVDVIRAFISHHPHQLKFVVATPDDVDEIDTLLRQLKDVDPADILLMPEGVDENVLNERAEWVSDICTERGFRFCPRLHILLFGHVRGV